MAQVEEMLDTVEDVCGESGLLRGIEEVQGEIKAARAEHATITDDFDRSTEKMYVLNSRLERAEKSLKELSRET